MIVLPTGRNLRAASTQFQEQINRLLTRTVTPKPIILWHPSRANDSVILSFRDAGELSQAPLHTRFGVVWLGIFLFCDATPVDRSRVQLRVSEYRYTVQPEGSPEPVFRWEYVRLPGENAFWCRNHVQGPIQIMIGRHAISLNDLHLPTGPVPIEEVIRFCIVDLGVTPLSDDWHERLMLGVDLES